MGEKSGGIGAKLKRLHIPDMDTVIQLAFIFRSKFGIK